MLIRILSAGLAAAVVFFLGGWVIWGILLRTYFEGTLSPAGKAVMSAEPNFLPLVLAEIVFGLLYAFILDYWASVRTFGGGAKAGAIIGFGISLATDLQMGAFMEKMHNGPSLMPLVLDVLGVVILAAIAGGIIGLVLGAMNKDAATA
jgi:hypothetical protein